MIRNLYMILYGLIWNKTIGQFFWLAAGILTLIATAGILLFLVFPPDSPEEELKSVKLERCEVISKSGKQNYIIRCESE